MHTTLGRLEVCTAHFSMREWSYEEPYVKLLVSPIGQIIEHKFWLWLHPLSDAVRDLDGGGRS